MLEVDPEFYDRADAHIELSNEQTEKIGRGKVSASMMYATARFNIWVSATGFDDQVSMREKKEETVSYFVEQYRKMLEENFDDYESHFARYMKPMK